MTHMTQGLHQRIMGKYENPVRHFVDYKVTEDEEKKIAAMTPEQIEAYKAVPEEYRIKIAPEYSGLISSLSSASDLAYEIANGIPNCHSKMIALGLLDQVCKYISKANKPEDNNGK